MISLEQSQITDILPEALVSPETRALSYALNNAVRRALNYAKNTSLYAIIDTLPENILDIMALELRTQYYDESFDTEKKRSLVKNTLLWYGKAGTVSAVQEMIDKVFDDGIVIEWFENGGEPGTFQISTTHVVNPALISQFSAYIENVKNIRSHLSSIVTGKRADATYYLYGGVATHRVLTAKMEGVN